MDFAGDAVSGAAASGGSNPRVFMDIAVSEQPVGRVEFELRAEMSRQSGNYCCIPMLPNVDAECYTQILLMLSNVCVECSCWHLSRGMLTWNIECLYVEY